MGTPSLYEVRRGAFRFGQYSDDTQLARELVRSFVARRGFDRTDYARRIGALFAEARIVGRGRATENAARRILTPSVLWSLYSFLRFEGDYWGAVQTAIAAGGDTDTTAAMTGALAGCHVGLKGLPQELCRQVNDRREFGYDRLVELSHELCSACS